MPDLADGESFEMQGSGSKPYVIKNVGGVYSCTCPAWRNQSSGVIRTCKHIRKLRGDAAEEARMGAALPAAVAKPKKLDEDGNEVDTAPPVLLAESWDNAADLTGWWISEKLDGIRAYWDGKQFISRLGNAFLAPDWFLDGLPDSPLDGELWIARKAFQRTSGIVRRQDKSDLWKEVRYLVFDAPAHGGAFEERVAFLSDLSRRWKTAYAAIHEHTLCQGVDHLREELARVEALGGEGLMLRQPRSKYVAGRSATLLKVKSFVDAEAEVIGIEPGKGKHKGKAGALIARLANGKQFSVGTGLSDAERANPPALGTIISFRYQELTDAGIPRFPSYIGIRSDVTAATMTPPKPAGTVVVVSSTVTVAATATPPTAVPPAVAPGDVPEKRMFECVEDGSAKFWEVWLDGSTLHTRWGKLGTDGRLTPKTFPNTEKAQNEYDKLVAEKVKKGYVERTQG